MKLDNIFDVLKLHKENMDIALKYKDKHITYKELYENSIKAADTILSDCGIVGILFDNSIDCITAFFSALYAGKIVMPLSCGLHENEIRNLADFAGLDLILTDELNKGKLDKINVHAGDIHKRTYAKTEKTARRGNDTALLLPTSGTTGQPKLAELSHNNIISNFLSMYEIYKLRPSNHGLMILPFSTAFSLSVDLLPSLFAGMTMTIYDGGFSKNKIYSMINRERIQYMILVPSLFRALFRSYKRDQDDLASLQRIALGGEKMEGAELQQYGDLLRHIKIIQGYGMTEASPVITTTTLSDYDRDYNSVGRTLNHVRVKITDDAGSELPAGEQGRIQVSGPNIMNGYYHRNTDCIKAGWLDTGDIGYLDREGYLYISGRAKNIIIVGGKNVFPEEIENIVLQYEFVDSVRVYDEKDDIQGESIIMEVVPSPSGIKREDILTDLKSYCSGHLPAHQCPRKILIRDDIAKNILHKTIRQ